MIDLVLLHIGQSLESTYVSAIGSSSNVRVVRVVQGSFSAAYDEDKGLAHDYPTLQSFVAARLPDHKESDPLVVVAFSAGCWAPRAWMRNAGDRKLVTALVLLDGLHSGLLPDGTCNPSSIQGVLDYAALCDDRPDEHLLVLTHTAIVPPGYASTTKCAALVERHASESVLVLGYNGDDAQSHNQQQTTVGPNLLGGTVLPWLASRWHQPRSGILGWIAAALAAAWTGWYLGGRRHGHR